MPTYPACCPSHFVVIRSTILCAFYKAQNNIQNSIFCFEHFLYSRFIDGLKNFVRGSDPINFSLDSV